MKYTICEATSRTVLEIVVNDNIKSGYVPIGGVNVIPKCNGINIYTQAMIKKGE